MSRSLEQKACGCVAWITWGTDGESLVHPCAAHDTLIGKVGVCSKGRPGLITGRKELPWGLSWVGIGLDNGMAWSSRSPRLLPQDEVARYAERLVTPEPVTPPTTSGPEVWHEEDDGA